jgi:hypothetical protein
VRAAGFTPPGIAQCNGPSRVGTADFNFRVLSGPTGSNWRPRMRRGPRGRRRNPPPTWPKSLPRLGQLILGARLRRSSRSVWSGFRPDVSGENPETRRPVAPGFFVADSGAAARQWRVISRRRPFTAKTPLHGLLTLPLAVSSATRLRKLANSPFCFAATRRSFRLVQGSIPRCSPSSASLKSPRSNRVQAPSCASSNGTPSWDARLQLCRA